jgi:hypothetical protein
LSRLVAIDDGVLFFFFFFVADGVLLTSTSGDMTGLAAARGGEGVLHDFAITPIPAVPRSAGQPSAAPSALFVEGVLPASVEIAVGGAGVIGRRVTVEATPRCRGGWAEVVGEGIVGFNI